MTSLPEWPFAEGPARKRRPRRRARGWDRFVEGVTTLCFVGGLAVAGVGMFEVLESAALLGTARDLDQAGITTTASEAVVERAPTGNAGAFRSDRLDAVVDLPHGAERLDLLTFEAETWHLDHDARHPAPEPYAGTFEVVYDPADPARVMATRDHADVLARGLGWSWVPLVAGVLWTAVWAYPAWSVLQYGGRGAEPAPPERAPRVRAEGEVPADELLPGFGDGHRRDG